MKLHFILAAIVLASITGSAQNTFTYDQIRTRNNDVQWDEPYYVGQRYAKLTSTTIDISAERKYHLDIISTTHLPDNGAIYLCKDENRNNVTIMKKSDDALIIYDRGQRYLIIFEQDVTTRRHSRAVAAAD